jgi:hypothetical protein
MSAFSTTIANYWGEQDRLRNAAKQSDPASIIPTFIQFRRLLVEPLNEISNDLHYNGHIVRRSGRMRQHRRLGSSAEGLAEESLRLPS